MKALDVYSHDTITCHLSQTVGYEMEAMHIHDVYEIYMALSDQVRFFVNNGMYLLEKGDVILLTKTTCTKSAYRRKSYTAGTSSYSPPDVFCAQLGNAKSLLGCFDMESGSSRLLKLTDDEQARFLSLARDLEQEENEPDFPEIGRWLNLGQLLLLLSRIQNRCAKDGPPKNAGHFLHIQKVLQYIDEHYTDPISLDALGAYCFLNKSYLCRLFKRETGFHIHDYIVYRRPVPGHVLAARRRKRQQSRPALRIQQRHVFYHGISPATGHDALSIRQKIQSQPKNGTDIDLIKKQPTQREPDPLPCRLSPFIRLTSAIQPAGFRP